MPTETDVKIAADLADFRVETERRFGQLGQQLAGLSEEFASFRGATTTELGMIRRLGDRLLATAFGVIGTMIIGSATIAWAASAVVADVKYQGLRIDRVEAGLDSMGKRIDRVEAGLDSMGKRIDRVEAGLESVGKQLQTLLDRTAPKAGR